MDPFPPITHVAFTVSDLERSVPWYRAVFGAEPVLDEDTGPVRHVVFAVGGTLFGLHQFPDPRPGTFDERRAGLDHVAFGVGDWHGHPGIVEELARHTYLGFDGSAEGSVFRILTSGRFDQIGQNRYSVNIESVLMNDVPLYSISIRATLILLSQFDE